jgi:transposase
MGGLGADPASGSATARSAHLDHDDGQSRPASAARRWLALDAEIKAHDLHLEAMTTACAPAMMEAHGISTGTAAEMLILVGDNPERIRSEAAFANLCSPCSIPESSGKTTRRRLNRGGHRQANAAIYRAVIVWMSNHKPPLD